MVDGVLRNDGKDIVGDPSPETEGLLNLDVLQLLLLGKVVHLHNGSSCVGLGPKRDNIVIEVGERALTRVGLPHEIEVVLEVDERVSFVSVLMG